MRKICSLYQKFGLRNPFSPSQTKFGIVCTVKSYLSYTVTEQMACSPSALTHSKCISGLYPDSKVERFNVPKDKISWTSVYPDYSPNDYTSPVVKGQIWADEDEKAIIERAKQPGQVMWNEMDSVCKINRKSNMKEYEIVDGLPRNYVGRTGIKGRGLLGRWGPNHAGDPIVTRWKRDADGKKTKTLQFIAIRRKDSNEWAIPGFDGLYIINIQKIEGSLTLFLVLPFQNSWKLSGMVDAGEKVSQTVRREFGEEAFNTLKMEPNKKKELEAKLKEFFKHGVKIYSGYVDDPRNTDNAWMETVAFNFHDEDGDIVGQFELNAGDDAVGVKWLDISKDIKLYASHLHMIEQVVSHLKADW